MAFTGKATYTAGATLPEIAEDVGDIIGIVSPYETPLLDHLGDPRRVATSTIHEWLEDELIPNTDTIDDQGIADPDGETDFDVTTPSRFRIGDQIQAEESAEVMFVTAVAGNTLTVVRGYGGTTPENIADGDTLHILGNAALEGGDAPDARFTNRVRRTNYTQIFTSAVQVSGTQRAVNTIGLNDELDYQKTERLRELMRDLENCVINGVAAASDPQGSDSVRRTMSGILGMLGTHVYTPGDGYVPSGPVGSETVLNEEMLNAALRLIWGQSSGKIDTIVVNGMQKRRINGFITSSRGFDANDTRYRDLVSVYESDFGVCRVVLSRWVPADAMLLLDSSRVDVLPLTGRSFHYKPLAAEGDRETGQLVGEYTLELRNENAHGVVRGLSVA